MVQNSCVPRFYVGCVLFAGKRVAVTVAVVGELDKVKLLYIARNSCLGYVKTFLYKEGGQLTLCFDSLIRDKADYGVVSAFFKTLSRILFIHFKIFLSIRRYINIVPIPVWEPLIHEKFMTLIPPTDHKFAALHGAGWSGGSFVYVPKGTKLDFPLQSYFRLNAKGAGQFEHTLIIVEDDADLHFIEGCSAPKYNVANLHAGAVELFVGKRAHLRYSTIENWSKNMYNLNTKRARVDEDGDIEWISGSFGSHVGYLYPMSVLNGRRARSSFTGITFAGAGQNLDTGCKVVLNAPDTSATVETKGISKSGGIQTFRSSIVATPKAEGAKATVSCQSLMLDDQSRSDTIPAMDIRAKNVDIGHEATIGRIGDDKVFYLMSRGISEEEARTMIVNGFANPVSKELPLEYAVEMNNLIKLEMEGAIG